ncbi:DUF481 domain-containing protein [Neolewinella lacunae]|uniref:DUF481 domain-containing protein n=1 Tax=Neolewinella lacunae TaxID=1517758 RepID=A0A923TAY3_9BACT|nr:DUF481 domain-containing protein [Neolewinella lacunae]MBC6996673.1 DUF481 domain-containing protein [Neolewinella lacunae]MDN3634762.1 DUF481 domain-containing protein [Neolewinella lacunae]
MLYSWRRGWAWFLPLLFIGLHGTCVRAQIVNIEDKRKALDSIGWFGQVDLSGSLTKNQTLVTTLRGGLRLDRLGRKGNVLVLGDYELVQVSGSNALNAGFIHLRYGYELKDKWRLETFTQVQYNEQLRLTLRFLAGTGIRRRLYKNNGQRAYLGVLYMYEYDELARSEITYRDHRMSSYLTLGFTPFANVRLANTTYYQPRLPDFSFPRVSTITTVEVGLTVRLRFTSQYSLTYDARVSQDLPDVPNTTYTWVNGLRWVF